MRREDLELLLLASAKGRPFTPVQVQKALFLIKEYFPDIVDEGADFEFEPYNYGPFDKNIYADLRDLEKERLAEITVSPSGKWNEYRNTPEGEEKAESLKKTLPENELQYIEKVSTFVRRLTFSELVSAIYKAYPEMKENSIFIG